MMANLLKIIAALSILIMVGCMSLGAGEGKIISSWYGATLESVIRRWGVPNRSFQLSDGKIIYEWHSSQKVTLPNTTTGTVTTIGKTTYVNATTTNSTFQGSCVRTLVVDELGIVLEGGARGNSCCVLAIAGYCASLLNPVKEAKNVE